jgi:hypothetical protein
MLIPSPIAAMIIPIAPFHLQRGPGPAAVFFRLFALGNVPRNTLYAGKGAFRVPENTDVLQDMNDPAALRDVPVLEMNASAFSVAIPAFSTDASGRRWISSVHGLPMTSSGSAPGSERSIVHECMVPI